MQEKELPEINMNERISYNPKRAVVFLNERGYIVIDFPWMTPSKLIQIKREFDTTLRQFREYKEGELVKLSIINREKILTKFNLNDNFDIVDKKEKVVDNEPQEKSIEVVRTKKSNSDSTENIEVSDKIPLKIIARLPCNIKFNIDYSNDYNYYITKVTNTNKPNFQSEKLVHLCIYNITNLIRRPPVLLFLLYKNTEFTFPNFRTDKNIFTEAEIKLNYIYENYIIKPVFVSYKETKNNIYLFYEIKEEYKLLQLNRDSKWWWTTISEIINFRKIMNENIDKKVYNIFNKEPLLATLFNKQGYKHFIGITVYFGGYENYIAFISSLGLPKESPTSNLGPYYYFYSYYGAGRRAIWSQSRKSEIRNNIDITRNEFGVLKRGGLVRFIIFGNTPKYFLNKENDPEDTSDISVKLAQEKPFIKKTLKIRDVDGNWAKNYDMAYIGSTFIKIPEKDYKPRRLTIQWAIRDFYQQLPLSFHYVNTDEFANVKGEEAINLPYEFNKYYIE